MEKRTPSQLLDIFWPGLLVVLIIAVSLAGIADHDLWTPDEPREAAIALDMSRSGNLIIPELAGKPFVEKPPLFYIIASFFISSLGQIIGNTAALRLVSACFGLLTLLCTYLLGKIYFDRQKAFIATAILATMIGFVHVTHWLLVDNALMFFITASVWALAKAYPDLPASRDNRLLFLPLAGILAAFAFLTKGMIGPIIIGLAWLGLFIPWVKRNGRQACLSKRNIALHLAGAIIGITISAVWITAFALKGGPELFREWWWTNHFGRFTGAAHDLGHISPWYYYFSVLPVYLLPWIVPFIVAIIIFFKNVWRAETIPAGGLLFIFWTLGGFLLLSLSATKRDIYLSALLPACALLCIYGLDLSSPAGAGYAKAGGQPVEIAKKIYWFWVFLLLISLLVFITAPLVKNDFFGVSFEFGWQQILALATILISGLVLSRATVSFLRRFLMTAAMCYATLLIAFCPVIDRYKSYGPAFKTTEEAIKTHPELKIAGWNLDETTLAGFYYYCGMVFPSIPDQKTLDDILQGRNASFNGVLTLVKNAHPNDLPDGKNQVIFESHMGKRRLLQVLAAEERQKAEGTEAQSD